MTDNQVKTAAVYIDGFNLYHPIKEMKENFLKWIDMWRLSEGLAKKGGFKLVKVVFAQRFRRIFQIAVTGITLSIACRKAKEL